MPVNHHQSFTIHNHQLPSVEAVPWDVSEVFEERQKRLLSEVEAERHDGCERMQRLRQELRRVEQERRAPGSYD